MKPRSGMERKIDRILKKLDLCPLCLAEPSVDTRLNVMYLPQMNSRMMQRKEIRPCNSCLDMLAKMYGQDIWRCPSLNTFQFQITIQIENPPRLWKDRP